MSITATSARARRHVGTMAPTRLDGDADMVVARASRLAARMLAAPFGALMLGNGEVVHVCGQDAHADAQLQDSPGLTHDIACILQGARRPDADGPSDRVASFATQPIILSDGATVGHLGAFDLTDRAWGHVERMALRDLAGMVASEVEARLAASASEDVRHAGRHLARDLSGLDHALSGLLEHAEQVDDPSLQHRASAVRARAADVRRRHDHLNSVVPQAPRSAMRCDVGTLVRSVADDLAQNSGRGHVRLSIEPFDLPVQTDEQHVRTALTQVLRHLVGQFGADAIRVTVYRRDKALSDLDGSISVEVEIAAGGGLTAGDLTRLGSCFTSGRETSGSVHLAVDGDSVQLRGPGIHASTTHGETRVLLSWPLDLG